MQYTALFHGCKNVHFQIKFFYYFFLFLLKTLIVGTHNQCFEAKIRKNVYPCKPQLYYIKVGCKGVFVTRTCFRDEGLSIQICKERPWVRKTTNIISAASLIVRKLLVTRCFTCGIELHSAFFSIVNRADLSKIYKVCRKEKNNCNVN